MVTLLWGNHNNDLQCSNATPTLLHAGVPEKIKGSKTRISVLNLTAINLTWGQPFDNNRPITSYIVSCDACRPSTLTVDGNVTSVVVSGLTPGDKYTFTVVAVNSIGNGPMSNSIEAQTATQGTKI